jgi:hypothetical protein
MATKRFRNDGHFPGLPIQRETTFYISVTHILVSTVALSLSLLGSGLQQWRTLTFLSVLELYPASATSFSKLQFMTTGPQQSSN